MDDAGTEHERGWLRIEDGLIAEVGAGDAPASAEDLGGAVVTPGLVNTHHHLYQTLTRARAQEADLFTWLKTLYPIWARIDDEMEYAAARTRARRARALGLHDGLRPPLRLPARRLRARRGRAARRAGARRAHRRLARLDGSRRVRRRPAARLRSSRTSTRSSPTPSGSPGSPTAPRCRSPSRRARRSRSRRG